MTTQPARILVVDDERDTCENLRDILSDLGYEVDIAFDGPSALALIEQHTYDVALLDLRMPGMDGLELYREIRRRSASTVAMIVTAYASSDTAEAAMRAGAWKVMAKPVDTAMLLSTLEQALEQPTVMIIDDDRELCESLWDVLRDRGYRVGVAHGTRDAQEQLSKRSYDIVLIDLIIPDGDGRQVFQMVRETRPEARTIIITGHRSQMEMELEQVRREGVDAICFKPFNMSELLERIGHLSKSPSK